MVRVTLYLEEDIFRVGTVGAESEGRIRKRREKEKEKEERERFGGGRIRREKEKEKEERERFDGGLDGGGVGGGREDGFDELAGNTAFQRDTHHHAGELTVVGHDATVGGQLKPPAEEDGPGEFDEDGARETTGRNRHGDALVYFARSEEEAEGRRHLVINEGDGGVAAHADEVAFFAGEILVAEDGDNGVGAGEFHGEKGGRKRKI